MGKEILRHIWTHPYRLVGTLLVLLALGWGAAGYAFLRTNNIAHEGRVENCRAIDELSRELRVAFADLHYPFLAARFESTTRCEDLP